MPGVIKEIWGEINELKTKYAKLCAKVGTVEGKISVLLSIGTGTLIGVIIIIVSQIIGGR